MNDLTISNILEYKTKESIELDEINKELNKIADFINQNKEHIIDNNNKSSLIDNYIGTIMLNNAALIPGGLNELAIKTLLKNEETQFDNIEKIKNYIIKLRRIIENNKAVSPPDYIISPINNGKYIILHNDKIHPKFNTEDIKLSNKEIKDLSNIKGIINVVLSGEFSLNLSDEGKEFINTSGIKSDPNLNIREFLDQSTTLVNQEFFKIEETNYNFLSTVCKIFGDALAEYKTRRNLRDNDIYFIYKGGNALRSIFKKYEKILPYDISNMISNVYSDYFKKSDSDFVIIINPNIEKEKWNEYFEDVKKISYLCLNRLRNIFLANLILYFDFYRLSETIKKKYLVDQLIEMNNKKDNLKKNNIDHFNIIIFNDLMVGETFNPNNIDLDQVIYDEKIRYDWNKYQNGPYRSDIFLKSLNLDRNNVDGISIYGIKKIHNDDKLKKIDELTIDMKLQNIYYKNSNNLEFYISWNDMVSYSKHDDETGQDHVSAFSLIRMKVNFLNYYKINGKYGVLAVPGEIIDISIPRLESYELQKGKIDLVENRRDIIKYTLNLSNKLSFDFFGFTYSYYHHDLNKMLLHETELIWQLAKYEKRLYRLFFIFTMIFIREIITNKDKFILFINEIKLEIKKIEGMTYINNSNIDGFILNLKTIKNIVIKYKDDNTNNDNISRYNFENICELFLEVSNQFEKQKNKAFIIDPENYNNVNKFSKYLTTGINLSLEIADKFIDFINNPLSIYKNINGSTIFETNKNVSFGGGQLEKYKIKAGYLSY